MACTGSQNRGARGRRLRSTTTGLIQAIVTASIGSWPQKKGPDIVSFVKTLLPTEFDSRHHGAHEG